MGALRLAQGARADRRRATTSSPQLVTPFVFRKYLDFDAYEGLRDIHRQIREQGKRRDYAANIKLGPGGIREIEFIVQALQIVRGGREPALRARGTLPALAAHRRARAAAGAGASTRCATRTSSCATSSTGCSTATTGRRRRCPDDAAERAALAAGDGLRATRRASTRRWPRHRGAVAEHFAAVFGDDRRRRATRRRGRGGRDRAGDAELDASPPLARRRRPGHRAATLARPDSTIRTTLADDARRACATSSRYLQLPALSQQRFDALVPQLLAVAAREAGARRGAADRLPRLLGAARDGQPAQRLPRAGDRASAAAAAARAADGRVAVGRRLT